MSLFYLHPELEVTAEMLQAAGLTCKAAGIDLSDFLNFRGSSVEAGSSVTRRQETCTQLGGELAAGLEAGLLGGGRRLRVRAYPSPTNHQRCAYTPNSSLARLRSFGDNRYSKVAFNQALASFF